MAYGTDTTQFLIKSGTVKIGTWTNPETIGTDNIDPKSKFSGDLIGNIKRGTLVLGYPNEFVEALGGTPAKLLRKDLIRGQFTFTGEIFEWNSDTLGTLFNRRTQAGYSITIGTKTFDISHIGSDQPTRTTHGILLETQDVNGREVQIGMYSGIVTPEDQSITLSGDDYATIMTEIEATPHPNFTTFAQDQDNYGYMVFDRT
jgi:hypothetical protein